MYRLALAVLALAAGATSASAQSIRSFSTFRQLHGETRLHVGLDYRAGGLRITPGRANELYRMDASYDENRYSPTSAYDAARGVVNLGLQPAGEGGLRVVSTRQLRQDATVAFAPSVDLDLDLALGAVQADIELGGLALSELTMDVIRLLSPRSFYHSLTQFFLTLHVPIGICSPCNGSKLPSQRSRRVNGPRPKSVSFRYLLSAKPSGTAQVTRGASYATRDFSREPPDGPRARRARDDSHIESELE